MYNLYTYTEESNYESNEDLGTDYGMLMYKVENEDNFKDDSFTGEVTQTDTTGTTDYLYNPNGQESVTQAITNNCNCINHRHNVVELKYNNYKKRIQEMFSSHYKHYFDKKINLNIKKNANEVVFYKELDIICDAINRNKKIKFIYSKPNLKELNKKEVIITPIDTYFYNNVYYLICQGNKNELEYVTYRLDYVSNVEIIEDSHVYIPESIIKGYEEKLSQMTYMYQQGHVEYVELEFEESVYSNIIDKNLLIPFIFFCNGVISFSAFLLIPLAVSISMFEREITAALLGAFAGLLWDLSAGIDGYNMLVIMLISAVCSILISRVMRNNIVTALVLGLSALSVFIFLYIMIYIVLDGGGSPISQIFRFYIPSFVFTSVFIPLYYYLIKTIFNSNRTVEEM